MFQEFFTDTLGGRFIKTLLQETPFPIFNSVIDGDTLVSGGHYIYKDFVIQCNTGGVLNINPMETLYPSLNLYPSRFLFPETGIRAATFYVRSHIDFDNPKIMRTYRSTSNHYDPDTHKQLGRYLRYIQTRTGINLLPYYNCYNHKSIPNIELTTTDGYSIDVEQVVKQRYKLVAIPILFGKKYTIAINCATPVLMRTVVYTNKIQTAYENELSYTGKVYSSMDFSQPVKYSVETASPGLFSQERNLYLLIQLPSNHNSAIVVLENFDSKQGVYCDENSVRTYGFTNSSLLFMDTHKSYAFSDRLIEYLTNNVICSTDPLTRNVEKIQLALADIKPRTSNMYGKALDQNETTLGIWDKHISDYVLRLVNEYSTDHFILDQDGNINKDVEKLILAKGVNY